MKRILIPLILVLLLSGCAKKQEVLALQARLEALEKDLGPYRYGALKPDLRVTFLKETFEESNPDSSYPKYHFSGVVNYVDGYPDVKTGVELSYNLVFDEDESSEDILFFEMDGDSAVFEEDTLLIGIPDSYASIKPKFETIEASVWPFVEASVVVQRQ